MEEDPPVSTGWCVFPRDVGFGGRSRFGTKGTAVCQACSLMHLGEFWVPEPRGELRLEVETGEASCPGGMRSVEDTQGTLDMKG